MNKIITWFLRKRVEGNLFNGGLIKREYGYDLKMHFHFPSTKNVQWVYFADEFEEGLAEHVNADTTKDKQPCEYFKLKGKILSKNKDWFVRIYLDTGEDRTVTIDELCKLARVKPWHEKKDPDPIKPDPVKPDPPEKKYWLRYTTRKASGLRSWLFSALQHLVYFNPKKGLARNTIDDHGQIGIVGDKFDYSAEKKGFSKVEHKASLRKAKSYTVFIRKITKEQLHAFHKIAESMLFSPYDWSFYIRWFIHVQRIWLALLIPVFGVWAIFNPGLMLWFFIALFIINVPVMFALGLVSKNRWACTEATSKIEHEIGTIKGFSENKHDHQSPYLMYMLKINDDRWKIKEVR